MLRCAVGAPMDKPTRTEMRTVLIVDDDELVLRAYGHGLSSRGFEVQSAADGLAAMHALRAHRPDAMVLDLNLPKLTGVDVLKFVRSQAGLKGMPVVVLSNCYMDDLAKEAAVQ